MRNPRYLLLSRNGVYYFRWPVPRVLHPSGKPSTIKVSLRTREPKEALHLARFLGYVAPSIVAGGSHRTSMTPEGTGKTGMTYHEMRKVLHEHFARLLASRKNQIRQSGPLSATEVAMLEGSAAVAKGAVHGENTLSIVTDDTELLERFITEYGLSIQPGTEPYRLFQSEFYKAYRDFCKTTLKYVKSLSSYDYSEHTARTENEQMPKASVSSVSIQIAVQKYIEAGVRENKWRPRSLDQVQQHCQFLQEFVGPDTDIKSIGGEQALQVKEALQKLPPNMNKNPATRNKSLQEILEIKHTRTINVRTVNDYLHDYRALFDWSKDHRLATDNPFEKLIILETNKNTNKRKEFSNEQLHSIEAAVLANGANAKFKIEHKWAALVAMYTGMRLTEVAQLYLSDIRETEGVAYIDVNEDGSNKSIKNESSKRRVPIHNRLIELGFLDYLADVRATHAERVFPGYSFAKKHGYGRALGDWFNNRLLVNLGIKETDLTFHSLRHSVITNLQHADVPEPIVQRLVGHTVPGVTHKHYFSGYKLIQLKAAIDKFSF